MPTGITLTEKARTLSVHKGSNIGAGNDSESSASQDINDDIFDTYKDLPILLPRDHDYGNDAVASYKVGGDGDSAITEPEQIDSTQGAPEELEPLVSTNLKIDKTKTSIPDFNFYSLYAEESDGTPFEFSQLKGKYTLITNVATRCGRQWHMEFLDELNEKYKENIVVLGFPSNSFLQNWKTAEETKLCFQERYECKFKIMEKVRVNGPGQNKVFKYLKKQQKGVWGFRPVLWNFEKFLVNREGKVVRRYSTYKHPHIIMADLDQLLLEEKEQAESEGKPDVEEKTLKEMPSSRKLAETIGVDVAEGQKVIYI